MPRTKTTARPNAIDHERDMLLRRISIIVAHLTEPDAPYRAKHRAPFDECPRCDEIAEQAAAMDDDDET